MTWEVHDSVPTSAVVRNDYAANGGSIILQLNDPGTLANGDAWQSTFTAFAAQSTGVIYSGSLIKMADVTDGASNTYLAGEKNLAPDYYSTGLDYGDNESALVGDDQDITRWTGSSQGQPRLPPQPDTPGTFALHCFGSAALGRLSNGPLRRLGPYDELLDRSRNAPPTGRPQGRTDRCREAVVTGVGATTGLPTLAVHLE